MHYNSIMSFRTGKDWREFRLSLIAERGPICQRCGKIIVNPLDLIGHHFPIMLTDNNYNDPTISLNPNNVLLVCHTCHEQEEGHFNSKAGRKVYIVYGSPLSGKHTFVRQQMKRGDLLIDIDALYAAVSGLPYYDKPNGLYQNVMAAHAALIDNIKTRYGKWNNCFIVGGYPEKRKREALADELGAELVYCEATKEECLMRLKGDEARRYRADEWSRYITDWFDRYGE